MPEKKGSVLLIVAWSLLGLFHAIALALFLWSGSALNPSSDEFAAASFGVVGIAWLADLVGLVLASVGLWRGRDRTGAIVSGICAILIAVGSAVVVPIVIFGRFLFMTPIGIH